MGMGILIDSGFLIGRGSWPGNILLGLWREASLFSYRARTCRTLLLTRRRASHSRVLSLPARPVIGWTRRYLLGLADAMGLEMVVRGRGGWRPCTAPCLPSLSRLMLYLWVILVLELWMLWLEETKGGSGLWESCSTRLVASTSSLARYLWPCALDLILTAE